MPRLRQRILPEKAGPASQTRQVINPPAQGGERLGGRPKGGQNLISKCSRTAIIEGLNSIGEDGEGDGGLAGYVRRIALNDNQIGLHLLELITPRPVEMSINRTETIRYETISDIERDLERLGIKPLGPIFQLDWAGDEVAEAEIVTVEPVPTGPK
jgi:hypothetical protein